MAEKPEGVTVQDDYCRDKAAPAGSSLYYATLFETEEVKRRLYPVFALHYEIADILTASPDPGVTRVKLQWWVEEIERLFRQEPRHPVATRLSPLLPDLGKDPAPLLEYLALTDSLVSRPFIQGVDEWFDVLSRGFGRIWEMASRVDGRERDDDPAGSRDNGGIIFILDLLQSLPLLASRGYLMLPAELLEKHGIRENDLPAGAGESAAVPLFGELVERTQSRLDSFYHITKKSRQRIPLYQLIMNRISASTCREIQQDGNRLLQHKIVLTPLRKLWIAGRTRMVVGKD